PDQLDSTHFEALLADAAQEHSEPGLRLLEEAMALWRGPALAEFADRSFAQPEAVRLDELYWSGRERRAELLLSLGRVGPATADLESLVAAQPHRERARGLLMEALYRQGRHTDALNVFQAWRRHLGEELGLEPSPELQRAEREILCHTLGAGEEHRPAARRRPPPVPVSSFVGREDDLTCLRALLEEQRLVTLVGPGGVGKTRLGLEVAAAVAGRYARGVCFCDLAPIRRGAGVVRAVASAVGLEERGTRRLEDQLADHLAAERLLLFLDSCEHVVDGAAALAEYLIQHTPQVDVLATSLERLAVDGEHLWVVAPLPVVGGDAPAVRLFVDRAWAVAPEFAPGADELSAISDICSRLDGLPLAIELAAARLRGLTIDELATHLEQRFQWLTEGRRTSPRHRSLRAVVDWSHDQLDPVEQRVFRRLTAFARSFDLEAARVVGGTEAISPGEVGPVVLRLVDRSLISERPTAQGSRYSMLDTVRAYGLEQLERTGELADARDRHAQWAVDFAVQAEAGLAGPDEAVWVGAVLDRWDELRAAHGWLVGRDDDGSLRLVAALHFFALWRTQSEVFRWAEVAAATPSSSPWLPAAHAAAGTGAWLRGDLAG
ncbi:MAG: ATP-binding protein, partial [Acidimicrobiia bacterium]